jgi:hypothetical protein
MEEKMNVRVDKSGHQRGVAEIDGFGAGGVVNGSAGGYDLFALDEDFPRGEDAPSFYIKQSRGMKNDRMRGSLRQGWWYDRKKRNNK